MSADNALDAIEVVGAIVSWRAKARANRAKIWEPRAHRRQTATPIVGVFMINRRMLNMFKASGP